MPLEDYKDVVGALAGIATVGQCFSGIFICKDIVKQGSTKDVPATPFLGGTAMGFLMLEYSHILGDSNMTQVNWLGLLLNFGYLLCYFAYSNTKFTLLKNIMYATIFVVFFLTYARYESPELVEFRFGVIMTVMMMTLVASPLFSLGEIIRTKSTATLPLPLILSGAIVTSLWLLYGIIIKNEFIQFQNIIGLTLCGIQLSLFAIYPNKPSETSDEKKKNL